MISSGRKDMGWYDILASPLYHGIKEDQGLQDRPIFRGS